MRFSLPFMVFVAFTTLFSCGGNADSDASGGQAPVLERDFSSSATGTPLANEAAIEAAFALDYRPQKPEGEDAAETLAPEALGGIAGQGRGALVGGALRAVAEYTTRYLDPAAEAQRLEAIRAAQEAGRDGTRSDTGPLTVIDWGPRGEFSAAIQRPSIYIIFSQPMVPLASLGAKSDSSPIVEISPRIKGSFRWYGTNFVSFEGDEPCQAQQSYTIAVAADAVSIHGAQISGERVFNFYTETLNITSVVPGKGFEPPPGTGRSYGNQDVPPQAAGKIGLVFNYPVRVEEIREYLEISAGRPRDFALSQVAENELLAELSAPVEFDREVKITLKRGARSSGGSRGTALDRSFSFRTPGPFVLKEHGRISGYGKYRNLTQLEFSYPLNESSLAAAISTEPEMDLGPENLEAWGSIARVYNLPVSFGEKFKIHVSTAVEDVYGRRLEKPAVLSITVPDEPPPVGRARFLDYGHAMLEAQFPPRFLFEYANIARDSWYLAGPAKNPWAEPSGAVVRHTLSPGKPNVKYFEEIDLGPYLDLGGKGFVSFRASLNLLSDPREGGAGKTWDMQNELNIQVTDLGLTVRYGFNKTVALVTKLSTGEPVENAVVTLLNPDEVENEDTADLASLAGFGRGVTGKDGLVVINTPAGALRNNTRSTWGHRAPYVMAEKDGDRAIFDPSSHNHWAFGMDSQRPQAAEEIAAVTFMFCDRGLYKPGETLTFRGVDRSQILGIYSIYRGEYTVVLEEDRYGGESVASVSGTVSESGGFYGSLSVPDDAAPGAYRLAYRRNNWGEEEKEARISANVPVTVAFFERLKFQAALSAPPLEPVSGEDITLSLRASYLSGGSLSGASWEGDWHRETGAFNPRTAETRGYVFGPRRAYDGKRRIASEKGTLSGEGTAALSQKTGDGSEIRGAPYLYSVEARVTDLSNQMAAAYRSILVHPARFYIGLARSSGGGFVRAGEEVSFDFITATPAGEKAGAGLLLQSGEDALTMTVELIREEWRRVQQRGVNGYMYDQYLQEQLSEGVQKISLGDGTFKATPPRAGFYTIRASALDREGKTALTELSFYATGSGGGWWNMNSADELRLTPDRDRYNPGDTAQILLQSPLPAGQYLITVEREGIFTEEVRHFADPAPVIEIPIARNFVPVVYVAISSYSVRSGPPVHQYGSPDLDKPRGYFGVTALQVNPRTRAFSVKVESDRKTYRPGEEVTMTLTAERDGKPLPNAELTLMAVDRGVLDLVNYHVPDPIAYFYNPGRFPLAVAGGDSRSWLMDPVTYSVKNLAGGDGEGESKIQERKDFNPTAVFEPMLLTDSRGKATCVFKLPDNLTTYRVTVFGVRGDLFALKESEIAAQNNINVREVLPRRLRERDTAEAGVLITNLDSASHTLTVRLDVSEPRNLEEAETGRRKQRGAAFVDGQAERKISLKSGENGVVYFDVAAVKAGTISLNFTINSDILNERLIRELLIEHPLVMETATTTGEVAGDGDAAEALILPSFADNNTGSLSISLDAARLSLLESAVSYLFRYPYGCMEQRSAAVFPLVVFGDRLDSLNLQSEVSDPVRAAENELKTWAAVQLPGGGFPYWPGGAGADFYVSLRIAHILAAARGKGISVPASIRIDDLAAYLDREYQELQKRRPSHDDYYRQSYLQAYMLYVCILLGRPVDPARLAEILSRANVDPSTLAFVGMTYRLLNRPSEAASTARRLRNLVRLTARGAEISDPTGDRRNSFYGGPVEQLALTLEFFVRQYPGDQINGRLLYSLIENKRAAGFWENTAVTVRVLSAVDALIRGQDLDSLDLEASATLAGHTILEGSFKGPGARPVAAAFNFSDPPLSALERDRSQPLVIKRSGRGSLYYTASLRYAIPAELQDFRDEGLGVFLSLHDVDTGKEIAGSALTSGTTYRARVRVSSSRSHAYVALRVPVPSGAEILDSALVTTASFGSAGGTEGEQDPVRGNSRPSHRIITDNETQYFWDRFVQGEATAEFLFRAVRRGVYPTPPAQAECMYESEIFGRSRGVLYTIE